MRDRLGEGDFGEFEFSGYMLGVISAALLIIFALAAFSWTQRAVPAEQERLRGWLQAAIDDARREEIVMLTMALLPILLGDAVIASAAYAFREGFSDGAMIVTILLAFLWLLVVMLMSVLIRYSGNVDLKEYVAALQRVARLEDHAYTLWQAREAAGARKVADKGGAPSIDRYRRVHFLPKEEGRSRLRQSLRCWFDYKRGMSWVVLGLSGVLYLLPLLAVVTLGRRDVPWKVVLVAFLLGAAGTLYSYYARSRVFQASLECRSNGLDPVVSTNVLLGIIVQGLAVWMVEVSVAALPLMGETDTPDVRLRLSAVGASCLVFVLIWGALIVVGLGRSSPRLLGHQYCLLLLRECDTRARAFDRLELEGEEEQRTELITGLVLNELAGDEAGSGVRGAGGSTSGSRDDNTSGLPEDSVGAAKIREIVNRSLAKPLPGTPPEGPWVECGGSVV